MAKGENLKDEVIKSIESFLEVDESLQSVLD